MPGSTEDDRSRAQREAVEREMRDRDERERDLVERVGDEQRRVREAAEDDEEG